MKADTSTASKSDWERVDATSDEEIDYSEIPELDDAFFARAALVWPNVPKAEVKKP